MRISQSLSAFCMAVLSVISVAQPHAASGALIGYLTTAQPDEIIVGDKWINTGFRIDWDVSQNGDGTWHYEYTVSNRNGGSLTPGVSHVILQLSENILASDLFNFEGDIADYEIRTYGAQPSNPGFPTGESIFGIKLNLDDDQAHVAFDSTRRPMWGDFYSKGGNKSFAYNDDLGVAVANLYDTTGVPVDAAGATLSKILVPDTISSVPVPEPLSLASVLAGGLLALRRIRTVR